jgi:hypothetical protein
MIYDYMVLVSVCQEKICIKNSSNKALHLTAIPLRSIAAGELIRSAEEDEDHPSPTHCRLCVAPW